MNAAEGMLRVKAHRNLLRCEHVPVFMQCALAAGLGVHKHLQDNERGREPSSSKQPAEGTRAKIWDARDPQPGATEQVRVTMIEPCVIGHTVWKALAAQTGR